MKESKRVPLGLLALFVLLLGYSSFITARTSHLEGRLKRVDGKYQELRARHHAFVVTVSNAMLQAEVPREVVNEAKLAILREGSGLPPATVVELPLQGVEVNSVPQVKIK